MKRNATIAALACILLAGCKQPTVNPAAPVTGSTNIVVHSSRVYQANVGTTDIGSGYYIVCQITFTNDLGHDLVPQAKNFVFYDASGQPHVGVDTGASELIGISNYSGVVKKDAKQDYTIGFRVPSVTTGSVYYAAL